MEKRRRAERLIAFLRCLVFSGLLVVAWDEMPRYHLYAIVGSVFVYNIITVFCLTDGRYTRFGKTVSSIARVLDIAAITLIASYSSSPYSSAYFAYAFVLLGSGLATSNTIKVTLTMVTVTAAYIGSTLYLLYPVASSREIIEIIEMRSVVLSFGWLVSLYIAGSRYRDDLTSERESLLQVTFHCGASLTSFKSMDELGKHLLQTVVAQTKTAGGQLWLVDEESSELKCEAVYIERPASQVIASPGFPDDMSVTAKPLKAYANGVVNSGKEVVLRVKGKGTDTTSFTLDKRPIVGVPLWKTSVGASDLSVFGAVILWGNSGDSLVRKNADILRIFAAMSSGAIANLLVFTHLQKSFLSIMQKLAKSLDARDEYTRGHSERVTQVSRLIGEELGVSAWALDILQNAALLHDIGKIGVSDEINKKVDELTLEEWGTMRRHPIVSEEICRSIGLPQEVQFLVKHHHERLDGRGYPEALLPQDQPMLQRILVVADSFDNIRSRHESDDAMPQHLYRSELKKAAGRTMDPTVVDVLLHLIDTGALDRIYTKSDKIRDIPAQIVQPMQQRAA